MENQEKEMSFLAHLEVLRWHLVRSMLAIILFAVLAFFYKDIVSLAKKNQNILFLIKSKHYQWLDIPYFNDILNEIKISPNIKILKDREKWTASNCIKNADFGIGLMSLL